jgi:hypothetical protein
MSQTKTYSIRCPQCDAAQAVELYEAANVHTDPQLREDILSNRLNAVTCDSCNFTFRVDKPLLYHDPDRGFMVNLVPGTEEALADRQEQFSEWIRELTASIPSGIVVPSVHLVLSRVELVERIFLLEAGLNERVVEYVKYLVYTRNEKQLNPATKALLFNAEDSTAENLCLVVQDVESRTLEGVLNFEREAYLGLCEMFDRDDQTPSLMELFPGPYVSARALLLRQARAEGAED